MKISSSLPLLFLLFCAVITVQAQQKIADNTTQNGILPPLEGAILELESTNKGLLLTRILLTSTAQPVPLNQHVAGMIVYNTATANDVIPGLYYNDGA